MCLEGENNIDLEDKIRREGGDIDDHDDLDDLEESGDEKRNPAHCPSNMTAMNGLPVD